MTPYHTWRAALLWLPWNKKLELDGNNYYVGKSLLLLGNNFFITAIAMHINSNISSPS